MKKFILKATMVAAFTAVAGYGVYNNQKEEVTLSDTALANVEALAEEEYIDPMCPNGCLYGGSGCLCHVWFRDYKEYEWEK